MGDGSSNLVYHRRHYIVRVSGVVVSRALELHLSRLSPVNQGLENRIQFTEADDIDNGAGHITSWKVIFLLSLCMFF